MEDMGGGTMFSRQGCPWMGKSQPAMPVTALFPSAPPRPAEPRDSTRYDVRVERQWSWQMPRGGTTQNTEWGQRNSPFDSYFISLDKPTNRNLKPTRLQKTELETKS